CLMGRPSTDNKNVNKSTCYQPLEADGPSAMQYRRQKIGLRSAEPHLNVTACFNANTSGRRPMGQPGVGRLFSHMFRGDSWYVGPECLRAATRGLSATNSRSNEFGFRLGRTLTPWAPHQQQFCQPTKSPHTL